MQVMHTVEIVNNHKCVRVPTGTLVTEAASLVGKEINQPCGGQGRCGRCAVQISSGAVRHRSTLRLTPADLANGFALGCQAVVEGDVSILIPPQEKVERRLATDRTVVEVEVPPGYEPWDHQSVRRIPLVLPPPSLDDQIDDWSRLKTAARSQAGLDSIQLSLGALRTLGPALRKSEWQVRAIFDLAASPPRLLAVQPMRGEAGSLLGLAVDVGTTTVSVWLVDLESGKVLAQSAEYNGQITLGEDVISRIIYASKGKGAEELRKRVLETVNRLVKRACSRVRVDPDDIFKTAVSGNSTMLHLFLGLPAENIRLSPFVTAANQIPSLTAGELGLGAHPEGVVDCLPCVASYVGADITAGVLSSGMADSEAVTLFIDVGTNGEIVLGSREWQVTCACSAGPAFEGAGVRDGMRATAGAIEEVWINSRTYEPTYRVIGGRGARGICGSGLLSLVAELFLTGLLDKGGNFNGEAATDRIRSGPHGLEYLVVPANESRHGKDIVLTHVDVDNLIRAKAAIFAGFMVLAERIGVPLEAVDRVLIGGAFGKYINVEKAVEIGLLPDLPWEKFYFLGNTSVKGAYLALLDTRERSRVDEIAAGMTYIELSADNSFYEAWTSALFLPHTDLELFPSSLAKLGGPVKA